MKYYIDRASFVSLTSLTDCPCLLCENIDACFIGGHHNSITCVDFTKWIEDGIAAKRPENPRNENAL